MIIPLQRAGREAEDEYDLEDPAKRGGQNGIRESVAENERHADAALPHGDAGSVPASSGIALSFDTSATITSALLCLVVYVRAVFRDDIMQPYSERCLSREINYIFGNLIALMNDAAVIL